MTKYWEIYEFDERGDKYLASVETNWRLVKDRRNVLVEEVVVKNDGVCKTEISRKIVTDEFGTVRF